MPIYKQKGGLVVIYQTKLHSTHSLPSFKTSIDWKSYFLKKKYIYIYIFDNSIDKTASFFFYKMLPNIVYQRSKMRTRLRGRQLSNCDYMATVSLKGNILRTCGANNKVEYN